MTKIGTVPYLNSLPLTHFLEPKPTQATPAHLSQLLVTGNIDVGLLPVFSGITQNLYLYPELGLIGCHGRVASSGFFVKNHIDSLADIKSIYWDKESKSSVAMAKIMLKRYFGHATKNLTVLDFETRHEADAQLLIGDKAFDFSEPSYQYFDLGELWKQKTGHGFVFACWTSKQPLAETDRQTLLLARDQGLEKRDEIIRSFPKDKQQKLKTYFYENIHYRLSPELEKGLMLYKQLIQECGFLS